VKKSNQWDMATEGWKRQYSEGDQKMRRYQKLLSVGLLALTPGVAMAVLLGGVCTSSSGSAVHAAERPTKAQKQNQELAQRVAKALQKIKLNGFDIQIDARNGVVTLDGTVASLEQRQAAANAIKKVSGVTGVNVRLQVAELAGKRGAVQPVAATQPGAGGPNAVRRAIYQQGPESGGAIQQVAAVQPGMPAGMLAQTPSAPMAVPAYGQPDSMGGHTIYNQPNLPNYAWPSYAQFPNYAGVTYPSQYSASAWPYIGPFYPYPQVPLNWRKATLEWNEGNWNLSFDTKFHRWCWFLDPHQW
jgi:hypothetical protein